MLYGHICNVSICCKVLRLKRFVTTPEQNYSMDRRNEGVADCSLHFRQRSEVAPPQCSATGTRCTKRFREQYRNKTHKSETFCSILQNVFSFNDMNVTSSHYHLRNTFRFGETEIDQSTCLLSRWFL